MLQQPERGAMLVHDVAELSRAGAEDLSVFNDAGHAAAFSESRAAAIVTSAKLGALPHSDCAILVCDDARLAFARIGQMFYPRATGNGRRHPSAHVADDAVLAPDVELAPGAVIEAGVHIGARSRIGANAVIGPGVTIGHGCEIGSNVSISHAYIGDRVTILPGAAIGQPGFGFASSRSVSVSSVGNLF